MLIGMIGYPTINISKTIRIKQNEREKRTYLHTKMMPIMMRRVTTATLTDM